MSYLGQNDRMVSIEQARRVYRGHSNRVLIVKNGKVRGGLSISYYLPCYIRLHIKAIDKVDIHTNKAAIRGVMLLSIYYGSTPDWVIDKLIGQDSQKPTSFIVLSTSCMPSKNLDPSDAAISVRHQPSDKEVHFEIRETFITQLSGSYFYTPFDTISIDLSFKVHPVVARLKNTEDTREEKDRVTLARLHFNLMDTKLNGRAEQIQTKITITERLRFGNYEVIPRLIFAFFTNSQQQPVTSTSRQLCLCQDSDLTRCPSCCSFECCWNSFCCDCCLCLVCCECFEDEQDYAPCLDEEQAKQEDDGFDRQRESCRQELNSKIQVHSKCFKLQAKVEQWPVSSQINQADGSLRSFSFAHYSIYLFRQPLYYVIINLIILSILNLALFFPSVRKSVGNLSGIIMGYVLLIPTFRSFIPDGKRRSLVEYLLYLEILSSLFTLTQIIITRFWQDDEINFIWYNEPLYLVVACINLFTIGSIIYLSFCYCVGWKRAHTRKPYLQNKQNQKLDRSKWGNTICDKYFYDRLRVSGDLNK